MTSSSIVPLYKPSFQIPMHHVTKWKWVLIIQIKKNKQTAGTHMHCYFDLIIMNAEFEGNTIIAATRQHQKKLYNWE